MDKKSFKSVVPGDAGDAMAPPDFGKSVSPISTRGGGGQIMPTKNNGIPQIFSPSYGPGPHIV